MPTTATEAMPKQVSRELRGVLLPIGVISVVVNLLMLTTPIYMLQIYDRVLTSRNITTLVMLSVLAAAFLAIGSYLNHVRSRVAERLAMRFEERMGKAVFAAEFRLGGETNTAAPGSLVADLDKVRKFLSGAGLTGIFDIPWVPIFILLLAILHPLLGTTAAGAAGLLLLIDFISGWTSRSRIGDGTEAVGDADRFFATALRQRDVVQAMNMGPAIGQRWQQRRLRGLGSLVEGSDITSTFRAMSAYVRQLAQMAMIGFGGYLAVYDIITPGVIVAGSIICARALGPLGQSISTVKSGRDALSAYRRLCHATENMIDHAKLTPLPKPQGRLEVRDATVTFEGQPTPALRDIAFNVESGGSLGIVGPAGSGKSVLARLLVGSLAPNQGKIVLGGHDLYREDHGRLSAHIGYVAQRNSLIDGSVLDNITRFQNISLGKAAWAAEQVGLHAVIEKLPRGYETPIRNATRHLTPSHLRMIEFARVICSDPALIVLDKPDTGLDGAGAQALLQLITFGRKDGRILVVASDRPAFVRDFDNLLVLWNGAMEGVIKPEKLLGGMQKMKRVTGVG